MIPTDPWLWIFYAHGVGLSWALAPEERQPPLWAYPLGLCTSLALLTRAAPASFVWGLEQAGGGMAGAFAGVLFSVVPIGVGAGCHALFVSRAVGELLLGATRAASGLDPEQLARTYDQAEAAIKAGELDRAAALLATAIGETGGAGGVGGDVQARRMLADVEHRRGRIDAAIALLEGAFADSDDPNEKGPLAFRLAELEEAAGRPQRARAALHRVRQELAGTRFASYAEERLGRLRA